jgi:hypothetical protein
MATLAIMNKYEISSRSPYLAYCFNLARTDSNT